MGDYYEGDFLNGKRHGKGVYKYQSGNIYEGDFVEGRKEGYGIFYFKERNEIETYEGMWLNDMAEGKGSNTLIDGEVMTRTVGNEQVRPVLHHVHLVSDLAVELEIVVRPTQTFTVSDRHTQRTHVLVFICLGLG